MQCWGNSPPISSGLVGSVELPPCCGSYCNSYGRPSWHGGAPRLHHWLLQLPRQYDIAMIFLKGLREDIHNQVEKTNAQWMASDSSSSCIRGPTGLLYRFACQLSALSLDAQWMAPSSSCIRSPTGQASMESETHKVWFSGAHAPNRNAKSPFSPKSEAQVSKQILGRSSGRHPQSS